MSLNKAYPAMVKLREQYPHLRRKEMYDYVKLEGKTNHGKNRIREHGARWKILQGPQPVQALDGEMGYLLESEQTKYHKWIKAVGDKNFTYKMVPEDGSE